MTPGAERRRPPRRVLFVCHEGQRTGAPLLLLWLLRWLTSHTDLEPVVALMRDGPLRQEFSALCPTHPFSPPPLSERWHRRLRRRLAPAASQDPAGWLAALVRREQPHCLYLNTLVLGYALGGLRFEPGTAPAVISHGHEMELGLMLSSQPELVQRQLALSQHVIACAEPVRQHLQERYRLAPTACTVIPEFLPFQQASELHNLRCSDASSQAVIETLQHWRRQGAFVFGFAGSPIDRKGFDLFPQLVKACQARFGATPFKAVWVGCAEGSRAHTQARRDLRLLGVEEQALLLPGVSCGAAALAQLQALALLSREDPYPVVALEAGGLGVPTVCFRGSGGIATLVEQGLGLAVEYLDLQAFAAALHRLQQQPALAQQLGQAMQAAVFPGHTLAQAGPAIAARIETQIQAQGNA